METVISILRAIAMVITFLAMFTAFKEKRNYRELALLWNLVAILLWIIISCEAFKDVPP